MVRGSRKAAKMVYDLKKRRKKNKGDKSSKKVSLGKIFREIVKSHFVAKREKGKSEPSLGKPTKRVPLRPAKITFIS